MGASTGLFYEIKILNFSSCLLYIRPFCLYTFALSIANSPIFSWEAKQNLTEEFLLDLLCETRRVSEIVPFSWRPYLHQHVDWLRTELKGQFQLSMRKGCNSHLLTSHWKLHSFKPILSDFFTNDSSALFKCRSRIHLCERRAQHIRVRDMSEITKKC